MPAGKGGFTVKCVIEMEKKSLLAGPFYDIKLFIFIPDTSAMPVIVWHHWCVPRPSGGPFSAHNMAEQGPILANLCPAISPRASVLGKSIHWRAIGSGERVSVLSCGPTIVHPRLPPIFLLLPPVPGCSSSPQPS